MTTDNLSILPGGRGGTTPALGDSVLRRCAILILLPALLAACESPGPGPTVGTPQPDPPDFIDLDGVSLDPGADNGGSFTLRGAPMTVRPPRGGPRNAVATIYVVDLDGEGDVLSGPVAADGSFEIALEAPAGHVLRVWFEQEVRDRPADFLVEAGGIRELLHPLGDCVDQPARFVEVDDVVDPATPSLALALTSSCQDAVEIASATLRTPSDVYTIDMVPAAIPAGGSASIPVGVASPGTSPPAFVLVRLRRGGTTDRFAFSVFDD